MTDEGSGHRRQTKREVARFWDEHPCGAFAGAGAPDEREFFGRVTAHRYESQPFMERLIGFTRYRGKRLLEVGCGLGTDLHRFARAGTVVTGMDLSERSITLARKRFALAGMPGAFVRGDAERLPFTDGSFDVVYSFGVLHHTPDTVGAINECRRVLRPGGELILMLYNRRSWHVVVEPWLLAVKRRLSGMPVPPGFTRASEVIRRYDGPANPLAKAYTPREVRSMLHGFDGIHLTVCESIPGPELSRPARLYGKVLRLTGITRRWGFWILARARRTVGART